MRTISCPARGSPLALSHSSRNLTRKRVETSTGDYCFNGVTRANVIALCRDNGIPITLGDFELADVHAADEAFVTGTFGGLTPVREVDGNALPAALPGPMTTRLRALYEALKDAEAGA